MKFSIVMMVSRSGSLFEKCIESLIKQNPDELRLYLDIKAMNARTRKLVVKTLVEKRMKEKRKRRIIEQTNNPMFDHHTNMAHNYHRMIMEASHKWVMYCDDDDEMLGNRREVLEKYAADDVGLIYGDKIIKRPNEEAKVWVNSPPPTKKTKLPILNFKDPNATLISGHSGVIYNRDAFRKIHNFLDHTYFLDYKSFYWIIRAGYRVVYVPQILSYQNVNPYVSPERRAWWGRWGSIVKELNEIPLGIIETVR